jgi:hypothetical protein
MKPPNEDREDCDVCGQSISAKSLGIVESGCIFCRGGESDD